MPVAAGASKEAPHGEKSTARRWRTRESLSELIEGRLSSADRRAALVKLATRLIVEEALRGREPRRTRPRLLRARRVCWPGLAQRRAHGSTEDGGRGCGLCGAADCRPRRTVPPIRGDPEGVPLGYREDPEGPHPGRLRTWRWSFWRGASRCATSRTRSVTRAGGLLLSRTAISEIGERLWRGLSGVRNQGPERKRHRLPVRGRHCRAHPAPGRSASRCWRPGASRRAAPRSCCT